VSAKHFLRAASITAAAQFAAHSLLFLTASPKHGEQEVAVINAMRSHAFNFAGSMRSYWDFYYGYGIEAAFICLLEAVLFWRLASFERTATPLVRQIAAIFLAANLGHVLLAARYFFVVPMIPDLIVLAFLGLALLSLRQRSTPRGMEA
jgi:hypothetical protein